MQFEHVGKGWPIFLAGCVFFAAGSTDSSGADLEEKLKAHLVSATDLTPGWELLGRTVRTDRFDFIVKALEDRKNETKGFHFKAQGIEGDSDSFNVVVFVFEDDRRIQSLGKTFEEVADNWDVEYFGMGCALYLIHPAGDDAKSGLMRSMGLQLSRPHLTEAQTHLEKGKEEDAARALSRIEESFKECGEACAWAGELYARHFSPPRTDEALRLFNLAIEAHKKTPLLPHTIWLAHTESAALLEARKEVASALASWRQGLQSAPGAGLRIHARTLFEMARLEAGKGEMDGAEASLEKALAIETRFGDSKLPDRIREEKALAPLLDREGLKGSLESAASAKCPQVFIGPSTKKVRLNKIKILVLPPDVLQGEAHLTAGEKHLETGLGRKFRKKCGFFGDRRDSLSTQLGAEFTSRICARVEEAVKVDGCFDLYRFQGNRHRIPGELNEAIRLARKSDVLKFHPNFILAVSLEIHADEGSLGERTGTLRACLYDVKKLRVTAFVLTFMELPEGDLKGLLLRLGSDVYRKIDSCLRSGKWK